VKIINLLYKNPANLCKTMRSLYVSEYKLINLRDYTKDITKKINNE